MRLNTCCTWERWFSYDWEYTSTSSKKTKIIFQRWGWKRSFIKLWKVVGAWVSQMASHWTLSVLRVFEKLFLEYFFLNFEFGDNHTANPIWRKTWLHEALQEVHRLPKLDIYLWQLCCLGLDSLYKTANHHLPSSLIGLVMRMGCG